MQFSFGCSVNIYSVNIYPKEVCYEKYDKSQGRIQYNTIQYNTIQYNTIQLYCLCVENFAFWLVIYIKHSIQLTIKHQQLSETRSQKPLKYKENT